MKVYVVTSGEYSDYTVEAVFSRKADADGIADRLHGDVLKMEVYDSPPPRKVLHVVEWQSWPREKPPAERSFMLEGWQASYFPEAPCSLNVATAVTIARYEWGKQHARP